MQGTLDSPGSTHLTGEGPPPTLQNQGHALGLAPFLEIPLEAPLQMVEALILIHACFKAECQTSGSTVRTTFPISVEVKLLVAAHDDEPSTFAPS